LENNGLALLIPPAEEFRRHTTGHVGISLLPTNSGIFDGEEKWLKPAAFNQGGYDAVHIVPDRKLVEFFQMTIAKSHELKLKFFAEFLAPCSYATVVDIYVVIHKPMVSSFSISKVSGQGMLEQYGWKSGHEKQRCKTLLMDAPL
jgi:hypothetical protein